MTAEETGALSIPERPAEIERAANGLPRERLGDPPIELTVLVPTNVRRCSSNRRDGQPCGATPGREAPFCFVHDPAKRELAAEAQHLGGLRRGRDTTLRRVYDLGGLTTIPEIRRYLEVGLTDTLALDNSVPRNRVLFAGVMAAVKLLEVGELTDEVRAIRAELDRPAADAAADDPESSA